MKWGELERNPGTPASVELKWVEVSGSEWRPCPGAGGGAGGGEYGGGLSDGPPIAPPEPPWVPFRGEDGPPLPPLPGAGGGAARPCISARTRRAESNMQSVSRQLDQSTHWASKRVDACARAGCLHSRLRREKEFNKRPTNVRGAFFAGTTGAAGAGTEKQAFRSARPARTGRRNESFARSRGCSDAQMPRCPDAHPRRKNLHNNRLTET
jgi:hypothetical protein